MLSTTLRLHIRALQVADAEAMHPVLADPRIHAYIPGQPYATVEALAERYRRLCAGSPDPSEVWKNWIVQRRADGALLGYLQATLLPRTRTAEVAYVLSPAHWGNGYATEALAWLIETLAREDGIDRVTAQIDARNKASLAVVQRLGFRQTGTTEEDGTTDHLFERGTKDLPATHTA